MGKSHAAPSCQLYLVLDVQAATLDHLAAILTRQPVASVLFKPVTGAKLTAATVKPLVDHTQSKNVAALLLDDVVLARALRADGVHISAGPDVMQRFHHAREILGTRASIGADAGGSRHTAMELGEAGADYIGFSHDVSLPSTTEEDGPALDELTGPFDQVGLVEWWSHVFEVPCVAFDVDDATTAARFASAGADFVAVMPPSSLPAAAVLDWLADMANALAQKLERADA